MKKKDIEGRNIKKTAESAKKKKQKKTPLFSSVDISLIVVQNSITNSTF